MCVLNRYLNNLVYSASSEGEKHVPLWLGSAPRPIAKSWCGPGGYYIGNWYTSCGPTWTVHVASKYMLVWAYRCDTEAQNRLLVWAYGSDLYRSFPGALLTALACVASIGVLQCWSLHILIEMQFLCPISQVAEVCVERRT